MKIVICWNEEFRKYKKFFHFRYFEFRKFRNSKISKILKIPKILFSIFAISKLENFENIENFRYFRFSRPRKFRKYSVIFVKFSSKIGRKRKYLLENENGFSRKYGNPRLTFLRIYKKFDQKMVIFKIFEKFSNLFQVKLTCWLQICETITKIEKKFFFWHL